MRRHPKCFVLLLTFVFILLLPTAAQAVPLGVTGFFGNPGATGETIGGRFSTTPRGIAVNDTTGDIYVADAGNSRIERFDEDGNFDWALGLDVIANGKPGNQPQNEVQTVALNGAPTGGSFVLRGGSANTDTAPIPYNATAAQVQAALEGIAPIGSGNVSVAVAPGGNAGGEMGVVGGPWIVEYVGSLADTNMRPLGAVASALTPSPKTITVGTTTEGAAVVEKCTVASDCKAGTPRQSGNFVLFAAGSPVPGGGAVSPQGIAVNQETGDFYVSDSGYGRIQQFDEDGDFISAWGGDVARSGTEQADESQRLTVAAAQGEYKLTYFATSGRGKVANGSTTVTEIRTFSGAFAVGQPISGPGIQPGTTIAAVGPETLTLSVVANANANNADLVAGPSYTTPDIAWNEPAAGVEAKLAGLAGIGSGNVAVSGGPGSAGGASPYLVSFGGSLANSNLAPLAVSAGTTPLSGGSGATIATFNEGGEGFEVCEAAANCKVGVAGSPGGFAASSLGYLAVAPTGAPNEDNVVVGDAGATSGRMQEFTSAGRFERAFGWDAVSSGPDDDAGAFEVCRAVAFDICKVGTSGNGVGQITVESSLQVAIDTDGAIYALESATCTEQSRLRRVQKFTPQVGPPQLSPSVFAEAALAATSKCAGSGSHPNVAPEAIAVDPTDDHVYVVKAYEAGEGTPPSAAPERRLLEFDPSATLVETHLAGSGAPAVKGLAVKAGGESAYLTAATPKPGVSIAGPPTPPIPTIEPPTGISQECATFHGTVNPQGGGPLLPTFYRFEYRPVGDSAWSKAPVPEASVGSGEAPVPVQQSPCSLQPNREYEVKLVAIKGGAPTATATVTFTTDPAPAAVRLFNAFYDVNSEELVLRGTVNPNNTAATYYFEYGADPCSSNPCVSVPEAQNSPLAPAGTPQQVTKRLADLAPQTTYHYRLIADNGVGAPVISGEGTITTPVAAPDPCPNAAVRVGPSSRLPECRGFEWVSNGDSWGSGIGPIMGSIADSGERAQFSAQAFGQPPSVPGPSTPYISQRTGQGWSVHQVVPSAASADGSYSGTRFMLAADLGSVLWPQSDLGQRLRGEVRWGTVGIDGSEQWASDLLMPQAHAGVGSTGDEYPLAGAAADLSSFTFVHSASLYGVSLLTGEPILPSNRSDLYGIANGNLEIVNRGGAVTGGNPLGLIGGACGAGLGANVTPAETEDAAGATSADGSIVHFTARPTAPPPSPSEDCGVTASYPKRLFKRIDATTTVEVSACAKTPPASCTPTGNDRYRGASRDGQVTFFLSPRQLTDSDTDSTEDLYVYDESLPPSERLIQASAGQTVAGDHPTIGSGAEVQGVLDNSSDGSRVYFTAKGRLTAAATKGVDNLYVFERDAAHPAGRVAFIGRLASGEERGGAAGGTSRSSFALPTGEDGDGHFLLFLSAAKLLAEDLDSTLDLYRYDDETGDLICLSCLGESDLPVSIASRSVQASWADYEQQARPASADVSAVVFTTEEGLAHEDTNGAIDLYLWRDGAISLISPGSGEAGLQSSGTESGISPDGEDVFFITRTAMVGADANNGLDLYDARVGGGFAEAQPLPDPCQGSEGCQGPASLPPAGESSGTDGFVGPGNQAPPKPCKKGQVRKHGKCVKKKAKKRKHGNKQRGNRAGNERGGKR